LVVQFFCQDILVTETLRSFVS